MSLRSKFRGAIRSLGGVLVRGDLGGSIRGVAGAGGVFNIQRKTGQHQQPLPQGPVLELVNAVDLTEGNDAICTLLILPSIPCPQHIS